MGLIKLLGARTLAEVDAARSKSIEELGSIFPRSDWTCDIQAEEYTPANKQNIWTHEVRAGVRKCLAAGDVSEAAYSSWLGEIHFINIRIEPRQLSQSNRFNEGWRVCIFAVPAARVVAVGIASHYQGAQAHNALGAASNLLFEVAQKALSDKSIALPGRRVDAADWDRDGLINPPITTVAGVSLPPDGPCDRLFLKDVRTTTVKKILASFVAIAPFAHPIAADAFTEALGTAKAAAQQLLEAVFPFRNLAEFEPFRLLALKDTSAARMRLQLRAGQGGARAQVRIYHGPPGTGKTLAAVQAAVHLIDPSYENGPSETFMRFSEMKGQAAFLTFHPSMQYEDVMESVRPALLVDEAADGEEAADEELDVGPVAYRLHEGVILRMIRAATDDPARQFVVVIDEINRGDLSRILGPLISALEPDKRIGAEFPIGFELQYSRFEGLESRLYIPSNFHVIGTMNSADRNIALVDYAIRRRFEFVAVEPDATLLPARREGGAIDSRALLHAMNRRITQLLGEEYRIGHGYLMNCRDDSDIVARMAMKVVPLLKEYFYGNPGLMLLVLGDYVGHPNSIHSIEEVDSAYDATFNVPRDRAARMGFRGDHSALVCHYDTRFWNARKGAPDDMDYAVKSIRKIYETTNGPA